jgi:O-antigen/teichoic acid export membrane protein
VTFGVTGRNVVANLFGSAWTALMSVVFVPVYLRFLGPEAFGLVGVLAALQAVFGVLDFGLGATFNREMARLSARGSDGTQERELLRTLEAVYWSIAAIVGIAIGLLAATISHRWVHAQHLAPSAITRSIVLMGAIVACQFPFALYQAGLLGRQRQVLLNVVAISFTTLRTLGAVLLISYVAPSIELFFAWQASLMLVQVVVTAVLLGRDLPRAPRKARIRLPLIRGLWRFSAAIGGNAILGVVLSQTDKILLSGMLPLSHFGYYTLAGSVAAVLWYVINPITTAFYPHFTHALHAGNEEYAVDTYHRACQLMALLLLPISATVAAFMYPLIFIWTGNAGLAQATAVTAALLICGTTLNGLATLPILLGTAAGFPGVIFLTNLIALGVIEPAIFFATRRFGVVGAASVWVILNSFYVVIAVPLVHRRVLQHETWRWYANDFAKPLIVAAALGSIARLVMPGNLTTAGTIAYVAVSGLVIAIATAMVLPHVVALGKNLIRGTLEVRV